MFGASTPRKGATPNDGEPHARTTHGKELDAGTRSTPPPPPPPPLLPPDAQVQAEGCASTEVMRWFGGRGRRPPKDMNTTKQTQTPSMAGTGASDGAAAEAHGGGDRRGTDGIGGTGADGVGGPDGGGRGDGTFDPTDVQVVVVTERGQWRRLLSENSTQAAASGSPTTAALPAQALGAAGLSTAALLGAPHGTASQGTGATAVPEPGAHATPAGTSVIAGAGQPDAPLIASDALAERVA